MGRGPVPLGYAAVDKKIVMIPAEAEAVCTIFARYLELGSLRQLADDLSRRGICSKTRQLANGRSIGGGWFGVGALAYLLRNRFYIGDVVYRGEVNRGDHAPILDRELFEAVQGRLAAQAVQRRCRLRGAPALLAGRIFDERGNRMSPTHTNKGGVRYRYYVSQAVLRNTPAAASAITRVPAPEIEALVVTALRDHLQANAAALQPTPDNERELVEQHVERVTLGPKHIKLQLRQSIHVPEACDPIDGTGPSAGCVNGRATTFTFPWTSPIPATVKGIVHVPACNTPMKPSRREALLTAIARARTWVDDLAQGRVASWAAVARREGMAERHVRLLIPLAFVSPRIVSALLDGIAPAGLTVTTFARGLPYSWAEQERLIGNKQTARGQEDRSPYTESH